MKEILIRKIHGKEYILFPLEEQEIRERYENLRQELKLKEMELQNILQKIRNFEVLHQIN